MPTVWDETVGLAASVGEYAAVARQRGWVASVGSDFHSPQESKIDLGTLPSDPAGVAGVWGLLADRIHRPGTTTP